MGPAMENVIVLKLLRHSPWRQRLASLAVAVGLAAMASAGAAADRHAGYYYPKISSSEVYKARAQVLPEADRKLRLGFIIAQTAEQAARPNPPRFAIFAKGEEAEKMIIIGLDGESFHTLYRARAVLAQLTARARATAFFRNLEVEDIFTFFDLARLLGFKTITVSDGETYAHRITLE